jgi:hypothetical protein
MFAQKPLENPLFPHASRKRQPIVRVGFGTLFWRRYFSNAQKKCALSEKTFLTSPVQVRTSPCNLRIAASVPTG